MTMRSLQLGQQASTHACYCDVTQVVVIYVYERLQHQCTVVLGNQVIFD